MSYHTGPNKKVDGKAAPLGATSGSKRFMELTNGMGIFNQVIDEYMKELGPNVKAVYEKQYGSKKVNTLKFSKAQNLEDQSLETVKAFGLDYEERRRQHAKEYKAGLEAAGLQRNGKSIMKCR